MQTVFSKENEKLNQKVDAIISPQKRTGAEILKIERRRRFIMLILELGLGFH